MPIIGNFATIFKCIYAKENLKTNIMKSFKSTVGFLCAGLMNTAQLLKRAMDGAREAGAEGQGITN